MLKLFCFSAVVFILATDIRYCSRRMNNFDTLYILIWLISGAVLQAYSESAMVCYLVAACVLSVMYSSEGVLWGFDKRSSASVWLKKNTIVSYIDKRIVIIFNAVTPSFIKKFNIDKKIERTLPGQWE
jgi:hypothetical protein